MSSKETTWHDAPSTGVQVVAVYYDKSYTISRQDYYDEHGLPVNRRVETEDYATFLTGEDYYWQSDDGECRAGPAKSVPDDIGLVVGAVKLGELITGQRFAVIQAVAGLERRSP